MPAFVYGMYRCGSLDLSPVPSSSCPLNCLPCLLPVPAQLGLCLHIHNYLSQPLKLCFVLLLCPLALIPLTAADALWDAQLHPQQGPHRCLATSCFCFTSLPVLLNASDLSQTLITLLPASLLTPAPYSHIILMEAPLLPSSLHQYQRATGSSSV